MRKIFKIAIVAMLYIVGASSANAQFRWGVTAGADFSTLKFKQDLITIDRVAGPEVGISTETMFPGIGFGMGSGLIYTMRGADLHLGERKVWASQGYGTEHSMLHYIKIPLNLRFKWTRLNGLEDYIAPFVFGGPSVSFLVAHSDLDALEYPVADFGLEVGFGVELMKNWHISAVHNWGMTYATKTKLLDDFSAQNRTWSVRLTYFIKQK